MNGLCGYSGAGSIAGPEQWVKGSGVATAVAQVTVVSATIKKESANKQESKRK